MKRRTFLAGAALFGAGIAGAFVFRPAPAAPEVTFSTFSGDAIPLATLRGQVVLVSFWASYCGPCRKDMPNLVAAHQRFAARGLRTVAVAVSKDDRARAQAYAREQALPFTVAFDDGSAARAFGNVRITPSYFLIDREGRLMRTYVGKARWAEMNGLVEQALAA
jgi:peroxiredoxin